MDSTLAAIAEVLRAAREPGASTDPEYFDLKALTFLAVAMESAQRDPQLAERAREMAAHARVRAQELRQLPAELDAERATDA